MNNNTNPSTQAAVGHTAPLMGHSMTQGVAAWHGYTQELIAYLEARLNHGRTCRRPINMPAI